MQNALEKPYKIALTAGDIILATAAIMTRITEKMLLRLRATLAGGSYLKMMTQILAVN